jgi:UDP-N-acetylglucosamine transferase subunit ALG13
MENAPGALWKKSTIRGRTHLIYVSVGNHFMGFERLLRMADNAARKSSVQWFAQIGCSSFLPEGMTYERFIPYRKSFEYIRNAACVISHAGIGTIINAERCGTPIIIVPRKKSLGEHTNDHQKEISSMLLSEPRPGVFVMDDLAGLEKVLAQVLDRRNRKIPYCADKEKISALVADFIELS